MVDRGVPEFAFHESSGAHPGMCFLQGSYRLEAGKILGAGAATQECHNGLVFSIV
jgi:hypothetical protein